MAKQLNEMTAHELAPLLAARRVSSREVTAAVYERIEAVEGEVHAFIRLTPERAMAKAAAVDEARASGQELSPLAGVPIALKDIMCTKGVETSCGSRILEQWRPPYDATVIEWLDRAGLVPVGKANMDEFAMGSSTENSAFGPTHNPWDLGRVPGGSSGGSTAAVAADQAILGIGTDTGGSIRQPAAFCGVVGLKPTYGRVSRYGLVAFASSLDQIGPVTKDVTDAALLLSVIAGPDPLDSTCINRPVPDYVAALRADVAGLRIGVPREYFEYEGVRVDERITAAVWEAVRLLEGLGAACAELSMPTARLGIPTYYLIAPAECSSNLARYDGVAYGHRSPRPATDIVDMYKKTRDEGFGPEVKRRVMLGTYALSAGYYDAFYQKAQQVRTLIRQEFERAFEQFDVLLTPTTPTPAFGLGEKVADPIQMYLSDVDTIPVNMAGLPAVSVPAGLADGLPLGLQIIGRPFDEETVLRVAYTFEQATAWHHRQAVPLGTEQGRRFAVRAGGTA